MLQLNAFPMVDQGSLAVSLDNFFRLFNTNLSALHNILYIYRDIKHFTYMFWYVSANKY